MPWKWRWWTKKSSCSTNCLLKVSNWQPLTRRSTAKWRGSTCVTSLWSWKSTSLSRWSSTIRSSKWPNRKCSAWTRRSSCSCTSESHISRQTGWLRTTWGRRNKSRSMACHQAFNLRSRLSMTKDYSTDASRWLSRSSHSHNTLQSTQSNSYAQHNSLNHLLHSFLLRKLSQLLISTLTTNQIMLRHYQWHSPKTNESLPQLIWGNLPTTNGQSKQLLKTKTWRSTQMNSRRISRVSWLAWWIPLFHCHRNSLITRPKTKNSPLNSNNWSSRCKIRVNSYKGPIRRSIQARKKWHRRHTTHLGALKKFQMTINDFITSINMYTHL